jgi:ABC-type uncharacterized transport system ATPase subunit
VLTPQEADEVLAFVRAVARRGECTVLMITHKFREVMAYADGVTVLRRGRKVHGVGVPDTTPAELAQAMIGETAGAAPVRRRTASRWRARRCRPMRRWRCRSAVSTRWATAARSRCRA